MIKSLNNEQYLLLEKDKLGLLIEDKPRNKGEIIDFRLSADAMYTNDKRILTPCAGVCKCIFVYDTVGHTEDVVVLGEGALRGSAVAQMALLGGYGSVRGMFEGVLRGCLPINGVYSKLVYVNLIHSWALEYEVYK